jgi:hypothetical protein
MSGATLIAEMPTVTALAALLASSRDSPRGPGFAPRHRPLGCMQRVQDDIVIWMVWGWTA